MPSISDAVALIEAAGVPILFPDTCILLDMIRAPLRPDDLPGCVEAAQELLQLVATPPIRCTLVVASLVPGEWLRHAGSIADELRSELTRIDKDAKGLHRSCGLMGINPAFPIPEYRLLPLADRLLDHSRRLLDAAVRLEPDHDCIIRAYGRAISYTPPSLKGGEVKDSTILEECLEVSRRLQAAGFSPKRVFCTSNTRDYCERGSPRLHPSLAVDFGPAGLEFAANLPWAVNEIRKP
jgi:hypothetical protein